jgi:hypothetical protein
MTISDSIMFLVIFAGFGLCFGVAISVLHDARRRH